MREFKHIAQTVRVARLNKGISQSELSRALGYKNGQFISNVERGRCSIPPSKLNLLCKAVDIEFRIVLSSLMSDYRATVVNYKEMSK